MYYNILCIILWFIAKFKLLYMTEKSIMIKAKIEKNHDNIDEEEISLSFKEKLKATYNCIIKKNRIFSFLWNILFSALAYFTKKYIFYIIQLFILFNLSQTLRNLLSSLTLKGYQLLSVFYLSVVINLCLAAIAFFKFEEDFNNEIPAKRSRSYPNGFSFLKDLIGSTITEPAHIESECGTFVYCFATHMDYGMRFDGGIADRMMKRSYNLNKPIYVARFFYEVVYFLSQTVMLQGMIFGIIIEAFSELRNKEFKIEKDKNDICFICGMDRMSCEKNGKTFEEHTTREHNLWTYVEYMLGLRFLDIQETNAINSYVMERVERRELSWFPNMHDNSEEGYEKSKS